MFSRNREKKAQRIARENEENRKTYTILHGDFLLRTVVIGIADDRYESLEDAVAELATKLHRYMNVSVSDQEATAYDDGSELAEARYNLEYFCGLSDEELNRRTEEEYNKKSSKRARDIAESQKEIDRLRVAHEKAEQWNPPSEFIPLKESLIESIEAEISDKNEGIKWLESKPLVCKTVEEYRNTQIDSLSRRVEYLESTPPHTAYSSARNAKRNLLLQKLRNSFAQYDSSIS